MTKAVTVNPSPSAIGGASSECISSVTTLNDAIGGGVWSSSNTLVTVDGSGDVTAGIHPGSVTISYTVGLCPAELTFVVDSTPGAIDGVTSVCTGFTITLADLSGGLSGTWSSSNTSVAIIESTGLVIPVSPGTATINYANGCGTPASVIVTVNQTPGAITGA